jgi:predicted RND superfamily exporter protein
MKHPWIAAVLLLPLVVAGWLRLRFETDILATLPAEVPEVRAVALVRDRFAGGTDLVVGVEAADDWRAEEAAASLGQRLEQRRDLVAGVRRDLPMEEQVQTGAALLAWMLQNADPEAWRSWRERMQDARGEVAGALQTVGTSLDAEQVQRASYDPLGLLRVLGEAGWTEVAGAAPGLVSEDGCFRLLLVTPQAEAGNYQEADAWLGRVRGEVAAWRQEGGFDDCTVRFTGEPAFQSEVGMGIERDMSGTTVLTAALIGLLFWFIFRSWRTLLWIQLLLALSMVAAIGLGGLLVGRLSVMSLGFAAIVLGLIVDYSVLVLQEARQHTGLGAAALRRLAAPGILAGAATTAAVFLSLTLCGMPGLAEMGLLVALGVLCGMAVMLTFMPFIARWGSAGAVTVSPRPKPPASWPAALVTGLLLTGIAGVFLLLGPPGMERQVDALRPRHSEAMEAFQWVQERLGRNREASVPVLLNVPTEAMRAAARRLQEVLALATADGRVVRQAVPVLLTPDPEAQRGNRESIQWLLSARTSLEQTVLEAGFTEAALGLLRGVCSVWEKVESWPQAATASAAADVLGHLLAEGEGGGGLLLASVSVPGRPGHPDRERLEQLRHFLASEAGAQVAGWEVLSGALARLAQEDLRRLLPPVVGVLLLALALVFRDWRDVLLAALALGVGVAALMATMRLCGLSWNLASLAAVPLLLGTGIDYGIHVLLALRRSGNAIRQVHAGTGRAVFFAGMTTVIGFSSLVFANNRGLAALGLACCAGVLWVLLIVLWLLPHWRVWLSRR